MCAISLVPSLVPRPHLSLSSRDRACTGHGSLASRSQVINTAGLRNDYTFLSGLQAQEIRLGSPDRFPRERCGLGTRLPRSVGETAWHFREFKLLLPLPENWQYQSNFRT